MQIEFLSLIHCGGLITLYLNSLLRFIRWPKRARGFLYAYFGGGFQNWRGWLLAILVDLSSFPFSKPFFIRAMLSLPKGESFPWFILRVHFRLTNVHSCVARHPVSRNITTNFVHNSLNRHQKQKNP